MPETTCYLLNSQKLRQFRRHRLLRYWSALSWRIRGHEDIHYTDAFYSKKHIVGDYPGPFHNTHKVRRYKTSYLPPKTQNRAIIKVKTKHTSLVIGRALPAT